MKLIFSMLMMSLFFAPEAFSQRAYDCNGDQTYELAQDIVLRTVEGATILSVQGLGVEQTEATQKDRTNLNSETWNIRVNYETGDGIQQSLNIAIRYLVEVDLETLQATCHFRSAVELLD